MKRKFTSSISSSSVKNQQQCYELLFDDTDDDSDEMLTVHEWDERQPSSLHFPSTQQLTAADLPTIEQLTAADLPTIEQSTTNDFLSIQQQKACEFPASSEMLVVDQQLNLQPQLIVSSVVAVSQHPDIPTAQHKTKRKPRRSIEAQKRRNQKSSLRHRRNRYKFELQRPTNIDVTTIKNILKEYHIKYENVNPVQSVVFISVKSQQQQQRYDQLLPVDIFLRT